MTNTTPEWDGERRNGRPVAHCGECGALRYVEDVEYMGEGALGGPNFSYRLGDLLAHERSAGPTAEDLGWVLYEMGVDDLSLDDARKLAAHIVVRLVANDDDPFRDERTGRTDR